MAKKNTVEIILSAKDRASKVTQKAFGAVQDSAAKAISAIGKSVAVVAGAAATLSVVVGKVGVGYNAMMEQSAIAWETILKSEEKAKKTLEELQELGAKTPFEFEGLDKAGKLLTMAQLGGDKLKESLTAVGDAVSAIGGNQETLEGVSMALFQMQAKGKVQAEEMLQMAERGLPVWDLLAEKMGKTPAQLMEMATKGELLAKDTVPLLVEALGDRFGGAMEKQSSTFNGLMSTLQDNAKILASTLTQGLFEKIKGYLPPIIDLTERFIESFQAGGIKGVMDEFLPPGVANFITISLNTIKDVFNQVKDSFLENKGRIVGVFTFIKDSVLNFVDSYKGYVTGLFSGEGNLGESFVRIFNTITGIALPILKDAFQFIKDTIQQLSQFWKENGEQIVEAVKNAWSLIAGIFKVIAPVILFVVKMLWDSVKGVISGALDIIMGIIKVFAGLFTGDFSKMWEGIKQLFFGAIEFLWNLINLMMFGRILTGIKTFVTNGVSAFSGFWTKAVEIFKNLDTHVWNIITGFVSKIITRLRGLYDEGARIFGILRGFGESSFIALKNTLISVADNIWFGIKSKFYSMYQSAHSIFDNIFSAATNIFNKIKSAITNPIETAKNTVKNAINAIKGFFGNMTSKIKMPHFAITWNTVSALGKTLKYPTGFDVNWYDKGGVFYGPQIIGVGEKRPEFVGALDDLRKIVREESKAGQVAIPSGNIEIPFIIDGYEFTKLIIPFIDLLQRDQFRTEMFLKGMK